MPPSPVARLSVSKVPPSPGRTNLYQAKGSGDQRKVQPRTLATSTRGCSRWQARQPSFDE